MASELACQPRRVEQFFLTEEERAERFFQPKLSLNQLKKIYSNKGSAIFFDSRLIHRGSPISKKKFKDVKFYKGEYKAKLPKEFDTFCSFITVLYTKDL